LKKVSVQCFRLCFRQNHCKIWAQKAIENGMKPNKPHSKSAGDELAPTRASLLVRLKDLDDRKSWQQFFDTYEHLIYGRVVNRGLSPQDAEDIVAEIVVGVARGMPKFVYDPSICSFKTWLFRVVENQVANHFRRRARSLPQVNLDTTEQSLLEQAPDPATLEPDGKWEKLWKDNLTQAALARVRKRANPRYLQLYLYLYSEDGGHSVAETAEHLQTTCNDVSVAKNRILAMLREEVVRLQSEEKQREQAKRSVKNREII
jgi:RNA polymerase sigma-70 factor (ECF subfamily)